MHQPTLARFAPAKINLFLEVLRRRPDGYHEIATVMETIAAGDVVEVTPADALEVVTSRPDVPAGEGNVAWKIVRAAEAALRCALPARIAITKNIPPGSGLGAGSSDAVSALMLVLALHRRFPPRTALSEIAAAVGSDTAFFLDGGLALCTGRGEIVQPLPQRGARHYVLVLPASECSTAKVYGALEISGPRREAGEILAALASPPGAAGPLDDARIFNRLAPAAERAYPDLAARRARLAAIAGRKPHLSGSGGTFFFVCGASGEARDLAASLRAAEPALDVRVTASYRGSASLAQP